MKDNLNGDFITCKRCGKSVYVPDFYAQNSQKWCAACAKIVEQENNLKRVHAYRERAKQKRQQQAEENKLLHTLNTDLKREIRVLQQLIQAQREQLDRYHNPDYTPAPSETLRERGVDVRDYLIHRQKLRQKRD